MPWNRCIFCPLSEHLRDGASAEINESLRCGATAELGESLRGGATAELNESLGVVEPHFYNFYLF